MNAFAGVQAVDRTLMVALTAVALSVAMGAILYAVARAVPDVLAHLRDRRERRRYVRTGIRELEVYLTRAPAPRRRQP